MKRILALLLALIMCIGLCACGSNESTDANDNSKQDDGRSISFKESNVIGDAEITFNHAFSTEKIQPPKKDNVSTSFVPSSGKVYFVLSAEIKNTGSTSMDIESLFTTKLSIGTEQDVPAMYIMLEGDGTNLSPITTLDALATGNFYIAFNVDPSVVNETATLTITDNNGKDYIGSFKLSDFEAAKKALSVGDTVTVEDFELTINDISFTDTLYPPRPNGYYHYFEAPNGKTLLVVSCSAKNLKGSDLKYTSIAGVNCVYDGKYNYSSYIVMEEDGGEDLSQYVSAYGIAPLDSNNFYYVIEVPQEVQTVTSEITFLIGTTYYSYTVSASN